MSDDMAAGSYHSSKQGKLMIHLFALLTAMLQTRVARPTRTLIRTHQPGSISGVVSWQTRGIGDKAIVGIPVRVWTCNGSQVVGTGVTDVSGRYEILNLTPGRYLVSAYQKPPASGSRVVEKCWIVRDVNIRPGQATQISLDFNNSLYADELAHHPKQCK